MSEPAVGGGKSRALGPCGDVKSDPRQHDRLDHCRRLQPTAGTLAAPAGRVHFLRQNDYFTSSVNYTLLCRPQCHYSRTRAAFFGVSRRVVVYEGMALKIFLHGAAQGPGSFAMHQAGAAEAGGVGVI